MCQITNSQTGDAVMPTTADKVRMINEAVAIPRNDFARAKLLKAEIVDGKVLYTAAPNGRMIRVTLFEALAMLHGEDARAIRAAL